MVRDIILGMSDGLTVPFALAAGLSAAVNSSFIVLIAGTAELAAGSIAMGLGGYLAGRSDSDHYRAEWARERRHIARAPQAERDEVRDLLGGYGLRDETLANAVEAITSDPAHWIRFMLRNELELEQPESGRARQSALTIGLSYVAGGIIPLAPYAMKLPISVALAWSAGLTLAALLVFGAAKGKVTGIRMLRESVETAVVGSLAAGFAYLLARLVNRWG